MTHLGHGAGSVIRHAVDTPGRTATASALGADLFVVHALELTRAALDGI
ncbi:MAG: hypothetical protein RL043_889, partial [Pseudomonadota bacterium]